MLCVFPEDIDYQLCGNRSGVVVTYPVNFIHTSPSRTPDSSPTGSFVMSPPARVATPLMVLPSDGVLPASNLASETLFF